VKERPVAIADFFAHPHEAYASGFYRDDDFDFDVRILLGMAPYGGADAGEVLQTIAGVGEGDHDKWFDGWSALGARLSAAGDASAAAGHDVSAAQSYLRAANYLGTAVNAAAGLPDADRLLPAFHAHRAAWDRFIDTVAYPTERDPLRG
jgi:hypothetical protein